MLKLASAEDEDSVEAISAESANPALGYAFAFGAWTRRVDHPDALSPESRGRVCEPYTRDSAEAERAEG
jgi:hypothetical protein